MAGSRCTKEGDLAEWLEGQLGSNLCPSLVRHCQSLGYRRSPGNLASRITRSIGECRMSWWSTLVVSLRSCGMQVNIRDGGPLATGEVIGYLHDD
jgi:hypothetical protein